jgi:hypothetical protein
MGLGYVKLSEIWHDHSGDPILGYFSAPPLFLQSLIFPLHKMPCISASPHLPLLYAHGPQAASHHIMTTLIKLQPTSTGAGVSHQSATSNSASALNLDHECPPVPHIRGDATLQNCTKHRHRHVCTIPFFAS